MDAKKSVPIHSDTWQGEECYIGTPEKQVNYNQEQKRKSTPFEISYSKNSIALPEPVIFGNKCGHNRLNPVQYIAPEHHKPRPSFLQSCIKKLRLDYFARKLLFSSKSKNRQKRSERLEIIILVLEAFLQYTDLATFKVGILWEEKYKLMPIQPLKADRQRGIDSFSLMREINRGRDSRSQIPLRRVLRAVKDIYSNGYMDVAKRKKVGDNGEFWGLTAIRSFKLKFFRELGFSREHLNHVQRQRVKEAYKQKWRQNKMTNVKEIVASFNENNNFKKNQLDIPNLSARDIIDAKIAASVDNFDKLKKEFPEKSVAQLAMELIKRRRPP